MRHAAPEAHARSWRLVTAAAALLACGSSAIGPLVPADTGQLITIVNYQYIPQRLEVVAGSSVLIRNEDPFPHTLTSESAPGAYTPGAVNGVSFDSDVIPKSSTRTISIPATAPVGTVVPYYSKLDGPSMVNQGEIEVVAP